MSISRKDYLLRLLEAFAEALRRLADLKTRGRRQEALDLVRETADRIFGSSLPLVDSMDPASAADLLGEPERLVMYARLVEEEAEISAMLGHHDRAGEGLLRARELLDERASMSPPMDEETRRRMRLLERKVGLLYRK